VYLCLQHPLLSDWSPTKCSPLPETSRTILRWSLPPAMSTNQKHSGTSVMKKNRKYLQNKKNFINYPNWHQLSVIRSWYTGRWWVGCYIWYSEEGTGRGHSRQIPSSLYQRPVYQSPYCCITASCLSWLGSCLSLSACLGDVGGPIGPIPWDWL